MMYTTMGAPLAPAEEEAILEHWAGLVCHAQEIRISPGDFRRGEDQVQMLNQAADLVQRIYALRQAISQAWHYANKRAFPEPSLRRPPRPRPSNAASLAVLNLTQRDLDEALAILDLTKGDTK